MNATDTDKYHKHVKDDNKHLNPLFDMKEVPKRTYQLGIAALCTGVSISVYDAFIGLYVSSFLVACFCFAILMFMLLKYNGDIINLTIAIICLLCVLIIASTLLEGLLSDQYLYFFPILISVPIIVNFKQKTKYRESFTYIAVILLSFAITIIIGRYINPQEDFTLKQINQLALINTIVAAASTIILAVAYIFFEEKYIHELTAQSKRVTNSRIQFLATMGHELRTPLNGIIGVINLLKQEHDLSQQEEQLQVLKYCADHMLQQVNNILDFNKIEADKLEIHPIALNLRQLLLNVGTPFIVLFQEKGLGLKIDIGPGLDIFVMADDLRLVQVFNNLFSNALKFTETGFVKLKAELTDSSERYVTVNFVVQDTGIGISADNQRQIFESFWQVYDEDTKKLSGTGLGLTICVRLIELMQSKLILVSEKGKGSQFSFELKLERADQKQQVLNGSAKAADNLAGLNILLAEDNLVNMMVAKKILTNFEAEVTEVFDGQETLNELEKNSAYDVILLDLEMPVMNGYTAIFEIKKLYPHIPVIAFTASLVDQKMLNDLLASGFVDCMLKPFQPQQLLSMVKKYALNPPSLV